MEFGSGRVSASKVMDIISGVNEVLGITDSYQAPDRIMETLLNPKERTKLFSRLLEFFEYKLDYDWFHEYYQEEHAERKVKKQDFTPMSVSRLIALLTEQDMMHQQTYECAGGTGGMIIAKWNAERIKHLPWEYRPSNYLYMLEELSDRAIPFLLLNVAIRGMNAAVLHGDTLERAFKQIYLVQNLADHSGGFSNINTFPRNKDTEKLFDVREWIGEPMTYIEDGQIITQDSQGGDYYG